MVSESRKKTFAFFSNKIGILVEGFSRKKLKFININKLCIDV